jgi:hypothetical protein
MIDIVSRPNARSQLQMALRYSQGDELRAALDASRGCAARSPARSRPPVGAVEDRRLCAVEPHRGVEAAGGRGEPFDRTSEPGSSCWMESVIEVSAYIVSPSVVLPML